MPTLALSAGYFLPGHLAAVAGFYPYLRVAIFVLVFALDWSGPGRASRVPWHGDGPREPQLV